MNRKVQIGDPPIRILRNDLEKLENLLDHLHRAYARVSLFLQNEVMRADVVERQTRQPFVQLGSWVAFCDEEGAHHAGTLHLPEERQEAPADGISILTPVGAALLGLSRGQTITYETIDRRSKQLTVLDMRAPTG
jgi:regulator of nucleoside diphosphate kinase